MPQRSRWDLGTHSGLQLSGSEDSDDAEPSSTQVDAGAEAEGARADELPDQAAGDDEHTTDDSAPHTEEHELLAILYVSGERLQDSRFKDAIIDAIVVKVNDCDEDGFAHYPVAGARVRVRGL